MKYRIPAILLLAAAFFSPVDQARAAALTQGQWMIEMVNAFGWTFGLPDEPQSKDYLRILSGDRDFRIEAEEAKSPDDVVSVKKIESYGPFSGEGWVSGISRPTDLHMNYVLPLSGDYLVATAVRRPGHLLRLDGETFRVDGESDFTEVLLGEHPLTAGPLAIEVQLPPSGGIDYVHLFAPPLPNIRPQNGWRTDAPLTLADTAVTAVRALDLEHLLPPVGERLAVEAETVRVGARPAPVSVSHLGQPSGGFWLRNGSRPGTVRLRFDVDEAGVYTLVPRAAAKGQVVFILNDRDRLTASFPVYLEEREIGTVFL
ncbi:MAG: hypothetical protein GWN87_22930, partial [Desulfuromonadales bacterium]|nr:hypothetical protein [Desulfuromonadales bacterium]NIS42744.1 hypothetical protein [Desulfuromonadales bacterium]